MTWSRPCDLLGPGCLCGSGDEFEAVGVGGAHDSEVAFVECRDGGLDEAFSDGDGGRVNDVEAGIGIIRTADSFCSAVYRRRVPLDPRSTFIVVAIFQNQRATQNPGRFRQLTGSTAAAQTPTHEPLQAGQGRRSRTQRCH